ncbi:hypothetical protein [Mycobacterium sp. C31M]
MSTTRGRPGLGLRLLAAQAIVLAAGAAATVPAVDDAVDSVVAPEQALTSRAAAATAASPYPYRLCCIAHPSSVPGGRSSRHLHSRVGGAGMGPFQVG